MVNKFKKVQVEAIKEKLSNANNMIFIDFFKCSTNDLIELRLELRKNNLNMFTLKNSLAKIALEEAKIAKEVIEKLNGQNAIIYGKDPITTSRITKNFIGKKPIIKLKFAYFEGKVYDKNKIDEYSQYRSKNDLIAIFISRLKQPMITLVFDLKFIINKFINVLKEIGKNKK